MDGRRKAGGWMGYDMDAASAVIVITVGTPLYEPRCAKAKTFRHEGFLGDSSAQY